MPGNFYSITPPNSEYTRNLASYVKQKYPGKTVVPVIEIDCMNCVNFADEFTVSARKIGINVRENPNGKFTADEAETIAVGPLVANINLGDIILMPNRSYTSGVMMARISKHLKVADLQFIGGDGWGDWSVGYAGKMKSPFKYVGARLNAWSLKSDSPNVIFFQKLYRSTYGSPADSNIALITFSTMRLITELANPKRLNSASETQKVILQELMRRNGQDPDFAHSKSYAIFEVTQDGEFFRGVFDGN
jgi:hypothetical protein